ncbi:MAG: EamA family transporter [Bryobacteraceae bacterium]
MPSVEDPMDDPWQGGWLKAATTESCESSECRYVFAPSRFRTLTSSWMLLSIATLLLWGSWGLESKIVVDRISPWMNQVLFSIGLLPLLAWMLFWKNLRQTTGPPNKGAAFGLLTGIFGGLGNVTFYQVSSKIAAKGLENGHTLDRMSQSLCDVRKG